MFKAWVVPLLRYGAIFGGAGLLYGGAKLVLETHDVVTLNPQPDAFGIDPSATHIFCKLNKYRACSEDIDTMYVELLHLTDRLLQLELALRGGANPLLDDYHHAASYAVAGKELLKKFVGAITTSIDNKTCIYPLSDIQELKKLWWEMMLRHVNYIGRRTDNIKPFTQPFERKLLAQEDAKIKIANLGEI
jgi:hypothetical protein